MKYSSRLFLLFSCVCLGCSSHLARIQQDRSEHSYTIQQIREEIADIKHGLNNTQVELQILEEEYRGQDSSSGSIDNTKLAALEKKIAQIASHANQVSQSLTDCYIKIATLEKLVQQQQSVIAEIGQLKSSLTTLIQSLQKESLAQPVTYRVKAGDSLEKIARIYKISITALKEENNLSSDKIVIGQELKIPGSS